MGYKDYAQELADFHGEKTPKVGSILLNGAELADWNGFTPPPVKVLKIIGILKADNRKRVIMKIREAIAKLEACETSSDLLIKLSKCNECVEFDTTNIPTPEEVAKELQIKATGDFERHEKAVDGRISFGALDPKEKYNQIKRDQKWEEEYETNIEHTRNEYLEKFREVLEWLES